MSPQLNLFVVIQFLVCPQYVGSSFLGIVLTGRLGGAPTTRPLALASFHFLSGARQLLDCEQVEKENGSLREG